MHPTTHYLDPGHLDTRGHWLCGEGHRGRWFGLQVLQLHQQFPAVPVQPPMAVDQEGEGRQVGGAVALRPELPERQELVPLDDSVEIEGVRISPASTSMVLKAACKCLGLSQSGSKAKTLEEDQLSC